MPTSIAHHAISGRPDVQFFCDLEYDPFLIMQDQNKVYGQHLLCLLAVRHLILSNRRFHCITLWVWSYHSHIMERCERSVSPVISDKRIAEILTEFIATNPGLVSPDNAMKFISDDGGETYNRCHCKYMALSSIWSLLVSSLEQLRDRWPRFMEERRVLQILRLPRSEGWILLWALGRCTHPQHWSCAFRQERPNSFLQRHRIPSRTLPALPTRWRSQAREMLVRPGTKLWWALLRRTRLATLC